jgi:hypothetical protein
MFNQYGAELRRLVTSKFSVEAVVQMHHADAFDSEVSAYPAVTVIRNGPQGSAVVACFDPEVEQIGVAALMDQLQGKSQGSTNAAKVDHWFTGSSP